MKKLLTVLLAALTISTAVFAQGVREGQIVNLDDKQTTITVYSTNDMHGRMDPSISGPYDGAMGLSKIAGVKANTENALLIDAGDATHGTPFAILSDGLNVVDMMNATGYDFMAIGNHEFDYGQPELEAIVNAADFPIASANIKDASGAYPFDKTLIKSFDGVRVGMFALTTEDTPATAMPSHVKGYTFSHIIDIAKKKVTELKAQGCDVIICIGHLGVAESGAGTTSIELIKAVDGIDLFIDGHSHTAVDEMIGDTLLMQSKSYDKYLGKTTITLKGDKVVSLAGELLDVDTIDAMKLSDKATSKRAAVQHEFDELAADFDVTLDETVGKVGLDLSAARAPGVRTQPMNIGYLVAEAYRIALDADISIANGGDIRADIPMGDVTYKEIITTLPFFNALETKLLTPALLKEVLENGVSKIMLKDDGTIDYDNSANGRFPQVAGFSFKYDATKPIGSRVVSVTLDGESSPLDLTNTTRQLRFAGSEYVMTGGDEYTMLADLPIEKLFGYTAEQALIEYLQGKDITQSFFDAHNAATRSVRVK
ncbi:MAG: bifunctional metallophosphatase/5'-nucleotidase [Sphaerochaetaceae bacterium]|nr:bifunctional metallophosphatase/5'-nucleotidase [Sphaerochaetaceae bacterium]